MSARLCMLEVYDPRPGLLRPARGGAPEAFPRLMLHPDGAAFVYLETSPRATLQLLQGVNEGLELAGLAVVGPPALPGGS